MNILYVYEGPQDPELEGAICRDVAAHHGPTRQVGSHSAEDGLTTVTLAFEDPLGEAEDIAQTLRSYRRIVDAARCSFGEGA